MTAAEAAVPAFVFGIANAAHCAGMCGVFAARSNGLRRFAAYASGKTVTYVALGTLAGAAGAGAVRSMGGVNAWLGLAAGAITVALGVRALGPSVGTWVRSAAGNAARATPSPASGVVVAGAGSPGPTSWRPPPAAWTALAAAFGDAVASARATGSAFLFGAATGALPCGVVYAAAVQGAATGSAVDGAITMAAFGFGTVPVLAVTSLAGRGVLLRLGPARVRTAGAIVVVVTGIALVVRSALPLLHALHGEGTSCCH